MYIFYSNYLCFINRATKSEQVLTPEIVSNEINSDDKNQNSDCEQLIKNNINENTNLIE